MNELNINETSILLSESKLYRESLDNCQPSKSNKQKEALLSLNSVIIPWLGRQDGGFRHLLAVLGNRGSILPRFLRSSFTEPGATHLRFSPCRPPYHSKNPSLATEVFTMAGSAGFEPANDGTKTRCLTAWRRPNDPTIMV